MRLRTLCAAAAVLCCSLAARADDFTYTLNGSAGGFSGTGTFSGSEVAGMPGSYGITSIRGSNTNGIIGAGLFGGNDNLLMMPGSSAFVDTSGIAFYDQTDAGVYAVRLYQSGGFCGNNTSDASQYCIDVQEVNTANQQEPATLPITFPGTTGNAARVAVRFSLARVATTPTTPTSAATPEPGSLFLLGSGTLAMAGLARRRFVQS